jgi:hypothetical protein
LTKLLTESEEPMLAKSSTDMLEATRVMLMMESEEPNRKYERNDSDEPS